jgi:hypothetical protein
MRESPILRSITQRFISSYRSFLPLYCRRYRQADRTALLLWRTEYLHSSVTIKEKVSTLCTRSVLWKYLINLNGGSQLGSELDALCSVLLCPIETVVEHGLRQTLGVSCWFVSGLEQREVLFAYSRLVSSRYRQQTGIGIRCIIRRLIVSNTDGGCSWTSTLG